MTRRIRLSGLVVACLSWALPIAAQPRSAEVLFSTTTAQAVATFDATDFRSVSVHVVSQGGSSTVTFQHSNDGTNWVSSSLLTGLHIGGTAPATSASSAGIFYGPLRARYFRLNVTGIVSGTTAGVVEFNSEQASEFSTVASFGSPGASAASLAKSEDAASATGDVGIAMFGCRNDVATQLTGGTTDYTCPSLDAYGAAFSREDHPNRIHCVVTVSTATTLTAVGGSCVAPGAALSIYVTDILFAANAGGIAADSFNTLKYGTGGTCGAGTAVFWGAFATAAEQTTTTQNIKTPIKIPANNELCWINSTAGSKFIVIDGFIAP